MRLSVEHVHAKLRGRRQLSSRPIPLHPTSVSWYGSRPHALQSFFATIERITADNPVPIARLQELAGKARLGQISPPEGAGTAVTEAPGRASGPCRRRRRSGSF